MKPTYVQTRAGVVTCTLKGQKSRSKRKGYQPPNYSKKELESWMNEQDYETIYNDYKDSNFDPWLRPSVDRIDSNQGYFFDNMRLGTWRENRDQQTVDIMTGTGSSGKACKRVRCIGDIQGVFVSINSAIRIVGYNMKHQLKTGRPDRNGRRWEYV